MRTLFIIPLVLMSLVSFPSWGETIDDLVERDGLYYKKFTDTSFTGTVEGKKQGLVKNGVKQGQWMGFWENGQLNFKGSYKNGEMEGLWIRYWEEGDLMAKGSYKNGLMEGRWVWFEPYGSVAKDLTGMFINGVKVSD